MRALVSSVVAVVVFAVVALMVSWVVDLAARRASAVREAAELEAGNRLRTALLAAVGHDLRTPLATAKAVVSGLRSRDVVLGRERVRRAQHDVRAAGLKRPHEVRSLGRDVEARGDAMAGQRLLTLESFPDRREDRHLPVGPLDPPLPIFGEGEVFHVVALRRCH